WFLERAFNEAIPNMETASQSLDRFTHSVKPSKGKVTLVGAGPGDPELLTVKALKLMQKADVVLHDSLVSEDILLCIRKDAKLIDVGKRALSKSAKQQDINSQLVFYARQGLSVLRLKGGDPFIFGRGGEELEYLLAHKVEFEVVPGITAAMGCASYSGIPLTHREYAQSLMFITAHCKNSEDSLDWTNLAREKQTLVVYMGLLRNQVLVDKMIEYGRKPTTPIAIIENGTTTKQRVITGSLNELSLLIEHHQIISPAMIIIGEVTQFAEKLSWYENSLLLSSNHLLAPQKQCA
ncbi:MAG: uroporphyrin-III C-methyltransferase/precorrin-2 dehydrogenase/sirohydrochlorin ferrochelatase, partial [Enterobacterales bacterium]